MRATQKPCPTPRCPELTAGGPCAACTAKREQQRGTAAQRGYGRSHVKRFRPAVLAKNHGLCVLCSIAAATVADHWPRSRRELELAGLDPNDPAHGRPLCSHCHSVETARLQPGGWATGPA